MLRLAFACSTGALAVSLAQTATERWHATASDWARFCLVTVLAAATAFFTMRGRDDVAQDPATVFLVAAAIVLPLGFAPFVALPAALIAALQSRAKSLFFLHRASALSLATLAASAIVHASGRSGAAGAGLLLAAAVAFAVVVRTIDVVFGLLGRRSSDRIPLLRKLETTVILALLGVGLASFWRSAPWLTPLAFVPLILVHRSRRLGALERRAKTDAKTGLLNMHAFGDALESAIAQARSERRPLSLVVFDLDLLREINNEHGHLLGDAVIRGISDVLRQEIRKGDLAARFGGEEFVLALPGTPPDRAFRIAERIREAVAGHVFSGAPSGAATRATISAGVAAFPYDAHAASRLIHAADLAVMAAKARGRNRVVDAAELGPAPARAVGRAAPR